MPQRPLLRYAQRRGFLVVHALFDPLDRYDREGRHKGTLLCEPKSLYYLTGPRERFDHDDINFCPNCRGLLAAKHFRGCDEALEGADEWTDAELARVAIF